MSRHSRGSGNPGVWFRLRRLGDCHAGDDGLARSRTTGVRIQAEARMDERKRTKIIHEGGHVAEVDVETVIDVETVVLIRPGNVR